MNEWKKRQNVSQLIMTSDKYTMKCIDVPLQTNEKNYFWNGNNNNKYIKRKLLPSFFPSDKRRLFFVFIRAISLWKINKSTKMFAHKIYILLCLSLCVCMFLLNFVFVCLIKNKNKKSTKKRKFPEYKQWKKRETMKETGAKERQKKQSLWENVYTNAHKQRGQRAKGS